MNEIDVTWDCERCKHEHSVESKLEDGVTLYFVQCDDPPTTESEGTLTVIGVEIDGEPQAGWSPR